MDDGSVVGARAGAVFMGRDYRRIFRVLTMLLQRMFNKVLFASTLANRPGKAAAMLSG